MSKLIFSHRVGSKYFGVMWRGDWRVILSSSGGLTKIVELSPDFRRVYLSSGKFCWRLV